MKKLYIHIKTDEFLFSPDDKLSTYSDYALHADASFSKWFGQWRETLKAVKKHQDEICLIFSNVNEIFNNIVAWEALHFPTWLSSKISENLPGVKVSWKWLRGDNIYSAKYPRGDNILDINWFEWQCYFYHDRFCESATKWYPENQKGLWMPGKAIKSNRVYVLAHLIKHDLLQHMVYSWKTPTDGSDLDHITGLVRDSKHDMTYGLSVEDLRAYDNTLDVDFDNLMQLSVFHYTGYPYDKRLYESTNWSLISESSMNIVPLYQSTPWWTEKTFRPIYNYHPYIIFSGTGSHRHLNQMGYFTFSDFYGTTTEHQLEQLNILNDGVTWHSVLPNLMKDFIKNVNDSDNRNQIQEYVESNKTNLINRGTKKHKELLEFSEDIQVICFPANVNDQVAHLNTVDFIVYAYTSLCYKNQFKDNLHEQVPLIQDLEIEVLTIDL